MLTDTGLLVVYVHDFWECGKIEGKPLHVGNSIISAGASGFCMANLQVCCPCHLCRVLCLWPHSGVWGGFRSGGR